MRRKTSSTRTINKNITNQRGIRLNPSYMAAKRAPRLRLFLAMDADTGMLMMDDDTQMLIYIEEDGA